MHLLKKLKIKEGMQGKVLNAPPSSDDLIGWLEANHYLSNAPTDFDFVISFVQNEEQIESTIPYIYDLKFDALLWMVYPKKSSKIAATITRDHGWNSLHNIGYQGIAIISIDETWSAFRFRSSSLIKTSKK